MKQKELDRQKAQWNWGSQPDALPTMTLKQYKARVSEGSSLIVIDGIIHDVTNFVDKHPGGRSVVEKFIGLDATRAFNGKVYNHSNAARNLLATLRISRVIEEEKKDQ
jgi:stearoyl-CoA desaturase (delta-9 desaturase)